TSIDLNSFPTRRSSDLRKVRQKLIVSMIRARMIVGGNTETRPRSFMRPTSTYMSEIDHRMRAHRGSRTPTTSTGFSILIVFDNEDRKSTRLNSSHVAIS